MLRSIPTRRIGALRDVVLYRAILGLTPPWTLANGEPDGRKKTPIRSCQLESAVHTKAGRVRIDSFGAGAYAVVTPPPRIPVNAHRHRPDRSRHAHHRAPCDRPRGGGARLPPPGGRR